MRIVYKPSELSENDEIVLSGVPTTKGEFSLIFKALDKRVENGGPATSEGISRSGKQIEKIIFTIKVHDLAIVDLLQHENEAARLLADGENADIASDETIAKVLAEDNN